MSLGRRLDSDGWILSVLGSFILFCGVNICKASASEECDMIFSYLSEFPAEQQLVDSIKRYPQVEFDYLGKIGSFNLPYWDGIFLWKPSNIKMRASLKSILRSSHILPSERIINRIRFAMKKICKGRKLIQQYKHSDVDNQTPSRDIELLQKKEIRDKLLNLGEAKDVIFVALQDPDNYDLVDQKLIFNDVDKRRIAKLSGLNSIDVIVLTKNDSIWFKSDGSYQAIFTNSTTNN